MSPGPERGIGAVKGGAKGQCLLKGGGKGANMDRKVVQRGKGGAEGVMSIERGKYRLKDGERG